MESNFVGSPPTTMNWPQHQNTSNARLQEKVEALNKTMEMLQTLASECFTRQEQLKALADMLPDNVTVGPLKVELTNTDLRDCLEEIKESIQILSPSMNVAVSCTFEGQEYMVWWNHSFKAVNIQKKENFASSDLALRQKEKIGFQIGDRRISVQADGQPMESLTRKDMKFLKELEEQIKSLKFKYEELKSLENRFNPDSLLLLKEFFEGPLGRMHSYEGPISNCRSLNLGSYDQIKAWMRIELASRSSPKKYIINFQLKDSFNYGLQKDKLGIQVDEKGQILSVYVDGAEKEPADAFGPESIWNQRLTSAINHFLTKKALDYKDGWLKLHPLVLSQKPEDVLSLLCQANDFVLPVSGVKFLLSTLEPSPGIDQGGPTAQLMCDLSRYLVDGSRGRVIQIQKGSGLPVLSSSENVLEKKVYQQLGRLIAFCFSAPAERNTGRILPDQFFGLLKDVIGLAELSDEVIIHAATNVLFAEDKWMAKAWQQGRMLNEEETSIIVDIYEMIDREDKAEAFDEDGLLKGNFAKPLLESILLERYKPVVLAAHAFAQGIPAGMHASIKGTEIEVFSEKVQGLPFNAPDIANRVKCNSSYSVVQQKAHWLKELILEQPKEWVLDLLAYVTGQRVVTAQTTLLIEETSAVTCMAHTCFKSLDVPITHVGVGSDNNGQGLSNKEKFLNNLSFSMAQKGYDVG